MWKDFNGGASWLASFSSEVETVSSTAGRVPFVSSGDLLTEIVTVKSFFQIYFTIYRTLSCITLF